MIEADLTTGEKFAKAASALEEISENEIEEEDREDFMTLFMELQHFSGKYEDGGGL